MTACATSINDPAEDQANRWFLDHIDTLKQCARRKLARIPRWLREDGEAEMLASTFQAVQRAARADKLDQLTPQSCIKFAGKQYLTGRRFAGTNSKCVLSEAARYQREIRVTSLDSEDNETGHALGATITDPYADEPAEVVRCKCDYPQMLKQVSDKACATFMFLAKTAGQGSQKELACHLCVSPARITQLKRELAQVFHAHGYEPPLGPRPAHS